MRLLETILKQMSSVTKPQYKFMLTLLTALMYLPGRFNLRNLGRYTDLHEKTFSRWFSRHFDFVTFNVLMLQEVLSDSKELVAALDASFVQKSGRKSYGLDRYWNGSHGRTERGQELSLLALVDVPSNTAYTLSTQQTPTLPKSTSKPVERSKTKSNAKKNKKAPAFVGPPLPTRIDRYLEHMRRDREALAQYGIRYLVADSHYAKTKFVNGVKELDLHIISKLRHDANLRWLYEGTQKPKGRHRQYDGKVKFDDLSRFKLVDKADNQRVYTARVNSPAFKLTLRIVYIVREEKGKIYTALLFSTDTQCSALDILRYYKARFQIEFLFRDAKQYTGLCDAQVTAKEKLSFHFNASLAALNLLRIEDRQHHQTPEGGGRNVISIASWKTRKFNAHLLERFSCYLGFDFTMIKSKPGFAELCDYGVIAV